MEKHNLKHKTSEHEEKENEKTVEKQLKKSTKYLIRTISYIMLVIIVILVVSQIPSYLSREQPSEPIKVDQYVYNGFNCTSVDNFHTCKLYVIEKQKWYDYEFRYSPMDLEYIPVYGDLTSIVNKSNTEYIYLSFQANLEGEMQNARLAIATYQVGRLFGDLFEYKIPASGAIIPGTDSQNMSGESIPLIDCVNATNKTSVIKFVLGEESSIRKTGNCYTIMGQTEDDLEKAADRFGFTLLGVMTPDFVEVE